MKTHQKIVCMITVLFALGYALWLALGGYLVLSSTPPFALKPLYSMKMYEHMEYITNRDRLKIELVEEPISVWKKVSSQVESALNENTQLTVSPTFIPNGGEVMVVWKNILDHDVTKSMDWIGLYCPSDAPHSQLVDFWLIKDLTAVLKVHASARFTLYNVRTDCQFRYFNSDKTVTKLLALSNTVNFENSQDAHLHIHLALTDSPSEMRVQWTTGKECVPTVHYGTSPSHLLLKTTGVSRTYKASDMCGPPANMSEYFVNPGHLHDVLLTKLSTNTQYYYRVSGTGVSSEVMTFRTPPPSGSVTPFSFIIYGDMDITQDSDQTAASVLRDIEKGSSFVLHIGDLSYATGLAYRWEEWMTLIEPLSSRVPYMVSIGNHEQCNIAESANNPSGESFHPAWGNFLHDSGGECGVPVSKRFHMPDNGNGVWWYSFKYGLAHIIQLSTEHSLSPGSAQHVWLERELKSVDRKTTPWLIVTGHRPLYTSEQYPSDLNVSYHLRQNIEDLLHDYHVDMFVAGHFHSYERICRVYKEKCSSDGTIHLVVGSAGFFLDTAPRLDVDWSKHFEHTHGYGRVTVANRSAMLWEFVRSEDRIVSDHIWLLKA